jgi:L1 cell adhesion molecule like protein
MPRGAPQIEVAFDLDANGILNVSASEKSSGKTNKITITNDKGRLSKDEIDRMVEEAERYKNEDEELRGKIEAKNRMEEQIYQLKSSNTDSKADPDTKKQIDAVIKEYEDWHTDTPSASKEEFEAKTKEMMDAVAKLSVTVPEPSNTVDEDDGPEIQEID